MIKKIIRGLNHLIGVMIIYFSYDNKPKLTPKGNSNKCVFVDLKHNQYSRYLYILLKFFHMNNYDIYLKPRFMLLYHIKRELHTPLILTEGLVHFSRKCPDENAFVISDSNFSADYFTQLLTNEYSKNSFHIPMSQHPLMYHDRLWNSEIENNSKRKKSILAIGNFDPKIYNEINKEKKFAVISRVDIDNFLKEKPFYLAPATIEEFRNNSIGHQVIIIKTSNFSVPMHILRDTISKFDFYFALPGSIMPFAHNIIEAMSVGTIPFLEETYARLFRPRLEHGKNAITFDGYSDLVEKINFVFELEDKIIFELRKNVNEYYNRYLTPKSVIEAISSSNYEKIFLQAEYNSVRLLQHTVNSQNPNRR